MPTETEVKTVECECEQAHCHGEHSCSKSATMMLQTIYGKYRMCIECADRLPNEYIKGYDFLEGCA